MVAAAMSSATGVGGERGDHDDEDSDRPGPDPRKGGLADASQLGAGGARLMGLGRLPLVGRHPHLAVPLQVVLPDPPSMADTPSRAAVGLIIAEEDGSVEDAVAGNSSTDAGDLQRWSFEAARAVLRCHERCVSVSGLCPADMCQGTTGSVLMRGVACFEPMPPLAAFAAGTYTPPNSDYQRVMLREAAAAWSALKVGLPVAM